MNNKINKKKNHKKQQNSQSKDFQQADDKNLNQKINKKVKCENSNSLTLDQILQNQKQIFFDIENLQQKEKLKEDQFQEMKNILEITQQKLKQIQNENKRNEVHSLLQQGSFTEKQFMKTFKNSLEKKVIKGYTEYTGIGEDQQYEFEFTSYLLPENSYLKYKCDMFECGNYSNQGLELDYATGSKVLKYVQEDGTSNTLLYYEVEENKLAEDIELPTYNKNFIDIINLNNFVKEILHISSKDKSLNNDILFEQLTKLFYSLSENERYFLNLIQ